MILWKNILMLFFSESNKPFDSQPSWNVTWIVLMFQMLLFFLCGLDFKDGREKMKTKLNFLDANHLIEFNQFMKSHWMVLYKVLFFFVDLESKMLELD